MDDGSNIQNLLTRSGLIGADDFESALEVSRFQNIPVGKILVSSGRLADSVFEAAVQVLSFIRDGLVSEADALESLKLVSAQGIALEDALADIGLEIESGDSSKLGNLLCAAKIVTRKQLYEAIHTGQETGIPLGECLKAHGILWEALLQHALSAQALLRSGFLDKDQAAKMIRTGFEGRVPVNYELAEFKVADKNKKSDKDIQILDLAVSSECVTQVQLEQIQLASQNNLSDDEVGAALIESGILKKEQLDRLVCVKKMVSRGTLDLNAAQNVLKGDRAVDEELSELLIDDNDNKIKIKFHDFLRIVNIVDKQTLERLGIGQEIKAGSAGAIFVGKKLVEKNEVDSRTIFAALRCYYLMGKGWLTLEQGTCALAGYVADSSSTQSFDDYLQKQEWVR